MLFDAGELNESDEAISMRRANAEWLRVLREWKSRSKIDAALQPGCFRKARRARGCPRSCAHCRAKKKLPTRQEVRATLTFAEWTTHVE